MQSSQPQRNSPSLKSIFVIASGIKELRQRQAYIDNVCEGDSDLRCRVEDLLSNADEEPVILDRAAQWTDGLHISCEEMGQFDDIEHIATLTIGNYELLERLGQGGMGTVYRAYQCYPIRRQVALKLIKPGMDSVEVLARFKSELKSLALMNHANIAAIYDAGLAPNGRPYITMELVIGQPIDEFCNENCLNLSEKLGIFVEVCNGVQHTHQQGIIHRDLKPSNILVGRSNSQTIVKVIDFGIAKAIEQQFGEQTSFTNIAGLIGTPLFMSPEQAKLDGQALDTRSDIYSLGVLLYLLVTGTTPLDIEELRAAGFDGVRRMICEEDPERLSKRLAGVIEKKTRARSDLVKIRQELDWIILKALEKDRERRYRSVAELADDIIRFRQNETVLACPPSVSYRVAKAYQRHRLPMLSVGFILLILVISAAQASWQFLETRRAWQASLERERIASDLREAAVWQTSLMALEDGNLAQVADQYQQQTSPNAEGGTQRHYARGTPKRDEAFDVFLKRLSMPTHLEELDSQIAVQDFSISASKDRIVFVDSSGNVNLRNRPGQPPVFLGTHGVESDAVAISPDGLIAVSGSSTGEISFWDLETAEHIRSLPLFDAGVETLVWSPDGKTLAAGGRYQEVWIGDRDGGELFRIPSDHRHEVLLFSTDSRWLLIPTIDTELVVWDIAAHRQVRTLVLNSLTNIRSLCWAGPDQQWLIAGNRFDEFLVVYDFERSKHLGTVRTSTPYAKSLASSPNGGWIGAAYGDGRVHLIELYDAPIRGMMGEVRCRFNAHRSPSARTTIQWIDDQRFVTAGGDGAIRAWDRRDLIGELLIEPKEKLNAVYFDAHNDLIHFYDSDPYNQVAPEFIGSHLNSLREARLLDNGASIVAAVSSTGVGILSLESKTWVSSFESPLHLPTAVTMSPEGDFIAVSAVEGICVWQSGDSWKSQRLLMNKEISTQAIPLFADQGKTLYVADSDTDEIVELDVLSGIERARIFTGFVRAMELDRDGGLLATASSVAIEVHDRQSGRLLMHVEDISTPTALAFFPGGRVLASAHANGKIHLWHVPTSNSLGVLFDPGVPRGRPDSLQLSPSGEQLLVWYRNAGKIRPVVIGRTPGK